MHPETWKAIGEYSGKVWTAAGPLVGVIIGALLARSWERQKWERENRKEEGRELLSSITHAATIILNVGEGNSIADADEAYLQSLKTLHGRIFIAHELRQENLGDVWARAVDDVRNARITAGEFSDILEQITQVIIRIVLGTG